MKSMWKQAFTLVELLIVITIMVMLTLAAYAPYQMYQTKQKVRNSAKIVAQTLYDARGMAINWTTNSVDSNMSIGVVIETSSWTISIQELDSTGTPQSAIEERKLTPWVKISTLDAWWWTTPSKLIFKFWAITWSWSYSMWNPSESDFTWNKLNIMVWFQWADTWLMTQSVDYYTKTYVADRK